MYKYDVLIVGAGLFGCVLAERLAHYNKNVLIVEKSSRPGGTIRTDDMCGITVHLYGAHVFRTNSSSVWNYINTFGRFKQFVNTPIAIHNNQAYNLPFNMNTFSKLWNVVTPQEAEAKIQQQIRDYGLNREPKNLEEYALSTVGKDIYETFIQEYTEKQWNKPCTDLPPSIMRRIPIRYTYDNNYYTEQFQGIPERGYSAIINNLLDYSNITLLCGVDGKSLVQSNDIAKMIVYTGCIDDYFDYEFGELEYRSLNFETRILSVPNYQGVAVVNHSDKNVAYTRTIEHKHFLNQESNVTVVTEEFPKTYDRKTDVPYYPIESQENIEKYNRYLEYVPSYMIFAGRLGSYKYTSMDETIVNATSLAERIKEELK